MRTLIGAGFVAVVLSGGAFTAAHAQEPRPAEARPAVARSEPPPAPAESLPVRLTIVLARYVGEKRISSAPFEVNVAGGPSRVGNIRMMVQVPVQAGVGDVKSFNYRDVGTNIDCTVVPLPNGAFTVNLTVEDSSVHVDEKAPQIVGLPSFRTFRTHSSIVLRDGQTRQFSVASDKVTGEVTRGDVTLTVVK